MKCYGYALNMAGAAAGETPSLATVSMRVMYLRLADMPLVFTFLSFGAVWGGGSLLLWLRQLLSS